MKKLVAILLISIYSGTAVGGVSINFHYCHGKLAKISFVNFGEQTGCGCNPKGLPKGCCKDELKCQKSENHKIVQPVQITEITSSAVEPPVSNENFSISLIDSDNSSRFDNKVQRSCPQIYLLNRVFRI